MSRDTAFIGSRCDRFNPIVFVTVSKTTRSSMPEKILREKKTKQNCNSREIERAA